MNTFLAHLLLNTPKKESIAPEIHKKDATQLDPKLERKILIVDDHTMNRRLLDLMLNKMGYFL